MKALHLLISISTTSAAGLIQAATGSSVSPSSLSIESTTSLRNTNHVFNAIRGAMRQWDSSWNHNGMSFFRATVPEGIQLYHGTYTHKAVMGMEWLAFEPEHAIGFARARMKPPPGKRPGSDNDEEFLDGSNQWQKDETYPSTDDNDLRPSFIPSPLPRRGRSQPHKPEYDHTELDLLSPHASSALQNQQIMHQDKSAPSSSPPSNDEPRKGHGYLHFYRTLHPLNLLLIDGMSAGKTGRGTLDSQDYALLLGGDLTNLPANSSHLAPFQDGYRAQAMCNISHDNWDNRIDGFIRMEAGFEIILCNFSAHLKLVRAQNVSSGGYGPGFGSEGLFRFYQAIADRFRGIGGGRVAVDFANMISAFSYDFDLFVNNTVMPGEVLPRLENVSQEDLEKLKADITSMVLSPRPKSSIDWQAVAEMVVQHFASPLQQLATPDLSPGDDFARVLMALLRPMISDDEEDVRVRVQRCVEQFVPLSYRDTYAGAVVHHVTRSVCYTLIGTLDSISTLHEDGVLGTNEQDMISEARDGISQLMSHLAWPIWKECSPSCGSNEVCVLPIWPLTSSVEERKHPTCKNATYFANERGPGGPGRRGDKNYWYDGDVDQTVQVV